MSSLEQAKMRVWIRDVIFILTFLAGLFMLWHNVDNRQALTEVRLDSLAEETYRIIMLVVYHQWMFAKT